MSYEDKEGFTFYSVDYKATGAESNALVLAVTATKESRRYESLKRLMAQIRITPTANPTALTDAMIITDEIVDLEVTLVTTVMNKARELGIDV